MLIMIIRDWGLGNPYYMHYILSMEYTEKQTVRLESISNDKLKFQIIPSNQEFCVKDSQKILNQRHLQLHIYLSFSLLTLI